MKRASLLALVTFTAVAAAAQTTPPPATGPGAVFLVRHAERADTGSGAPATMGTDPDLSEAGRARAAALAFMLKNAGITAIYTTEYKRTRQTAEPLAKALGIEPVTVGARDLPALVAKLKDATGSVLVVGHSNTVPDAIMALGVSEPVTIGDAEYDNLFVVTRGSPPHLLRLQFR
jgi:2,3-bisphosphoglycerate-dependent phosphoglycerate mutase